MDSRNVVDADLSMVISILAFGLADIGISCFWNIYRVIPWEKTQSLIPGRCAPPTTALRCRTHRPLQFSNSCS